MRVCTVSTPHTDIPDLTQPPQHWDDLVGAVYNNNIICLHSKIRIFGKSNTVISMSYFEYDLNALETSISHRGFHKTCIFRLLERSTNIYQNTHTHAQVLWTIVDLPAQLLASKRVIIIVLYSNEWLPIRGAYRSCLLSFSISVPGAYHYVR